MSFEIIDLLAMQHSHIIHTHIYCRTLKSYRGLVDSIVSASTYVLHKKKKQIFFFHLNLWATRNEWIKIWLRHVLVFLYLYEKVVKVGRLCFDCFLFGCGIICWFRFRFGHSFGSENSERNQSKPTRHERRNKISIVILQMFGWNTWCRHGATSEPHSTTITHIWTNIKKPLKYLNDIISCQSWEAGRICCSFPTLRECSIDQTQTTRTEIRRKKMYDFY